MVCHGKGRVSILGPADKVPQDENKTKRTHMAIAYSHVILVNVPTLASQAALVPQLTKQVNKIGLGKYSH